MTPPTKTARNEQRKLLATTINTIAVAIIVSGLVVPGIAYLYGTATTHGASWPVIGAALTLVGVILHRIAFHILGGLKE